MTNEVDAVLNRVSKPLKHKLIQASNKNKCLKYFMECPPLSYNFSQEFLEKLAFYFEF